MMAILSKKSTCIDTARTMTTLHEHARLITGKTQVEEGGRAAPLVLGGSIAQFWKKVRYLMRDPASYLTRFRPSYAIRL